MESVSRQKVTICNKVFSPIGFLSDIVVCYKIVACCWVSLSQLSYLMKGATGVTETLHWKKNLCVMLLED